ncbi:MAG: hypothetical protein ABI430_03125 [Candidatus Taylorbacteria bacterium]
MIVKKLAMLSVIMSLTLGVVPALAEDSGANTQTDTREKQQLRNFNLEKMQNELQKKNDDRPFGGILSKWRGRFASTTPFRDKMGTSSIHKREEIKDRLKTLKNKNIADHVDKVVDRLGNAVDRLLAIGTKLEERMNKMEDSGIDLTQAEVLLTQFKTVADQAKEDIISANSRIQTILEQPITSETGPRVRAELKVAEESVKGALKALVDVIKSVKANVRSGDDSATSTSNSEN